MPLPFDPPVPPMLAKLADAIPDGDGWIYEPKWDGFRTLVFLDDTGEPPYLQSRDLKPMARYFPEAVEQLAESLPRGVVLDGELVIVRDDGLDFDLLSQRIHPAESRVRRLAVETPSSFIAFDILGRGDRDLRETPFRERRALLEETIDGAGSRVYLTPATLDIGTARRWFEHFEGAGLDGVIAKPLDAPYASNVRAMLKIKHKRTADCVVGGYRWQRGEEERAVGSLLLGLYGDDGVLHFVGHTSSFKMADKRALVEKLAPYVTDEDIGFGRGRTPGEPSRWTGGRDMMWVRVRPELVCEVSFDHLQGERFRHAATFLRWRTDKPPEACAFDQLETAAPFEFKEIFRR
jgi:ATP-dependent DNA ligase